MIYAKLLEGINPQWSVKEKAKYLYEQVCINSYFDDRIDYTEDEDLIRRIYYRDVNIDEDETDLVVCRTASLILYQLLARAGIKSRLVKEKPNILSGGSGVEDVALVFYDGEDEYFCNPVGDIQNCKYTMMPRHFGIKKHRYSEVKNVKKITPKENREIDRKIGYIPKLENGQKDDEIVEDSYSNIVLKEIIKEVKDTQRFMLKKKKKGITIPEAVTDEELEKNRDLIVSEKLKMITELIKWKNRKISTNERKQLYVILFKTSIFNRYEKSRLRNYYFYRQEGDSVDIIPVVELRLATGPIYYIYSKEENTYISISYPELREKINGYKEKSNKRLLIEDSIKEEEER